jgi:DNA-binding LacI/PurR family transcriptional regulator
MRPTLQEIAEAVDLSVSTVSRALNGHPAISEASAARVRQVAEKLRYQRRKSQIRVDPAQTLAGRKVAMVTLGVDRSMLVLPVIANAVNGVEAALSEAGAEFRLIHVPDSVAVLVYRALTVRKVEVAAEISVISANNDEAMIAGLHPRLTTFDVHAESMGRTAVRHLATRILGGRDDTELEITIPATRVERESVTSRKTGAR